MIFINPYINGVAPENKLCVKILAMANPVAANSGSTQLIKIP